MKKCMFALAMAFGLMVTSAQAQFTVSFDQNQYLTTYGGTISTIEVIITDTTGAIDLTGGEFEIIIGDGEGGSVDPEVVAGSIELNNGYLFDGFALIDESGDGSEIFPGATSLDLIRRNASTTGSVVMHFDVFVPVNADGVEWDLAFGGASQLIGAGNVAIPAGDVTFVDSTILVPTPAALPVGVAMLGGLAVRLRRRSA